MSGGQYRGKRNRRDRIPPALKTGPCPHPGKQAYASKDRAKVSLKRMTGVTGRETLRAYKCECGTWHLGHKPGSRGGAPVPKPPRERRDAA